MPYLQCTDGAVHTQARGQFRQCVLGLQRLSGLPGHAQNRLGALVNSPNLTVALKAVDMVLTHTDLKIPTFAPGKSYAERSDDQLDSILEELMAAR